MSLPVSPQQPKPRLARDTEVAEYLSLPVGTIRAWASRGQMPGVIKLGRRSTRYDLSVIAEWIAAKTSAVK